MASDQITGDKYAIQLVSLAIDVNHAIEWVNHCQCGALSLFMGNTRRTEADDQSGRHVVSLDYEAYHPMALKQMQTIVEQNLSQYKDNQFFRCFVAHRLGRVAVGQTSLLIACSSPHRTEAHELVLKILNDIKAKVPIWKKINYQSDSQDSHSQWSEKSEAFWLQK